MLPAVTFTDRVRGVLDDVLVPALAGEGWAGHVSCVDVRVNGSVAGIRGVTVEGEPLVELLQRTGHEDVASSVDRSLRDDDLSGQLENLRRALTYLWQ